MREIGLLRFYRDDAGLLQLSEHWNPHLMGFSDRLRCADELEKIATLMRNGLFHDGNSCREFPAKERRTNGIIRSS